MNQFFSMIQIAGKGDLFTNVANLFNSWQSGLLTVGYAVLVISIIVCGIMFIFPSERSRQFAKQAVPYICLGAIVLFGATAIASFFRDEAVLAISVLPFSFFK